MALIYCKRHNDLMAEFEYCQCYAHKSEPNNEYRAYCIDCAHSKPAIYLNMTRRERLCDSFVTAKIYDLTAEALDLDSLPVNDGDISTTSEFKEIAERVWNAVEAMVLIYDSETTVFYA